MFLFLQNNKLSLFFTNVCVCFFVFSRISKEFVPLFFNYSLFIYYSLFIISHWNREKKESLQQDVNFQSQEQNMAYQLLQ